MAQKNGNQQGQTGRQPPQPAQQKQPPPAPPVQVEEPLADKHSLFRIEDWIIALITTLFSGAMFYYYMAPEVTLQDSGELVTGAFTFGVPHPPGYPFWAFLGYVWSHFIFPFGNPAWRIGMMSVVTGACTVGVLSLMMTRSTRILLSATPWTASLDTGIRHWIAATVGASSALLFGFNRGVWLWACVSEMRVLNVFSFVLIACVFMCWICQPHRRGFLYTSLLLCGLSFANHQTVAIMVLPIAAGVFAVGLDAFFRAKSDPANRDEDWLLLIIKSMDSFIELTGAGGLTAFVCFSVVAWLQTTSPNTPFVGPTFFKGVFAGLVGLGIVVTGLMTGWWRASRTLIAAGVMLLGVSFYMYMPIASTTNPPMNWGYASTVEGFYHAISRGQYEKLNAADPLTGEFLTKIYVFGNALRHQYSSILCLFGFATAFLAAAWRMVQTKNRSGLVISMVVSFAISLAIFISVWGNGWQVSTGSSTVLASSLLLVFWLATGWAILSLLVVLWMYLTPPGRALMVFAWAAFLATSFGLLTIINPKLDRQEQEITIKFFAPAHGFYTVLIGYGIAFLIAIFAKWATEIPGMVIRVVCLGLFALPLISYKQNWALCNLRGHDFGYLFGYLMFNPGGDYPPMEKDAVLYGGTDPGRFVPTYMIFCESRVKPQDRFRHSDFDRSDVYIITQNALADGTYMNYIRDHYDFTRPDWNNKETIAHRTDWQKALFGWSWTALGRGTEYPKNPIFIPSKGDSEKAFQQYFEDVKSGRVQAGADVKVENGRVSVQGVGGVMTINGILAKWIFDKNNDKHSFYVEESYVIPWMYPYLKPAGIIMKIEKDQIPSPQENPALWKEIVDRDKKYWDNLTTTFTNRPEFVRNNDAKKSFSKLRSAIAGIYAFRGMVPEAEYAFRQSLALCPESPEANFRLAELYMRIRKYEEAEKLIQNYIKIDEFNGAAKGYLGTIKSVTKDDARRAELEKQISGGQPVSIQTAIELASIYQRFGMEPQFSTLTKHIFDSTNAPPEVYMAVAQLYRNARNTDMMAQSLRKYLAAAPANWKMQIELAAAEVELKHNTEAMSCLRTAVIYGNDQARDLLKQDARFMPLANLPEFRALFAPMGPMPLGQPMNPFGRF